jgi:CheY-like chemotaxis protein
MERALARILVVDDDEEVLEVAVAVLANLGHAVTSAHSAADALRLLGEDPAIELLFTDVMMPGGVNGFELARHARAMRPDLRVIYATGYAKVPEAGAGEIFGPVLEKPYRAAELAEAVEQRLG